MTFYLVDAFTNTAFQGNPAGIVILDQKLDELLMQRIAAEMNVSETAFVLFDDNKWSIRWFSPTIEIDLCGHATLASAHILKSTGRIQTGETVSFFSKSGMLAATLLENTIRLDFPNQKAVPAALPQGLEKALGIPVLSCLKNHSDFLVETDSQNSVKNCRPDLNFIAGLDARGLMITARADEEGLDFVSRFFGPAVGIPEDPVTGSAHCALTPFWAEKLQKTRMQAKQISARTGNLTVEQKGDRIWIEGQAITVWTIETDLF